MERRVVTVFGGSGFIGRHLVRRLAADGWVVRVAVRDPEGAAFLKMFGDPGQIVPLFADVADAAAVATATSETQAVINFVGILYEKGRRTFQRIHVEGAGNIARAAREAGAQRLVHISAIGADRDSPAKYGRTKAAGERAVGAAFPEANIIRPSIVFGPEDDFFNRFATLARFLPALPVFETKFQPVYVGDVADAIMAILKDPSTAGRLYELGGPRVISFRELMELMLHEIGRRRILFPLPLSVAEMEAFFLEMLPVPPLTRDQVKLLGQDNVVDPLALTFKDLGIQPTAVEAVIPTYLGRYRHGHKPERRAQ
jgi:NADH dehydrogenase